MQSDRGGTRHELHQDYRAADTRSSTPAEFQGA
ncbi:hypothetical protein F441_09465 [Phytophthora nicotianae CJ01A1]|uniref:Uncharacterized protein n=3 Tax=Phytophthora nicotianae TaxID=4792 RepID=W2Q5I5_PHYN3|nr:hypothetical protein PPTG_23066 [Phytophthora nicotianae INRA-310]ETN08146.1 hypothetical protein PPTG_23066 [Phytophthora nicotianae INRA-310]ETP15876.1 hypothetical protein F441_09465 [Phytophthora nicotianae CJ01A1]ETP43925.1 hypothetical protein F442_09440 [Phytophthora nicotianae P10297]